MGVAIGERLNMVPQQYFKKLIGTEDLWEIRTQMGGNSYQFLGFFDGSTLLILTSGFSKEAAENPSAGDCAGTEPAD